MKPFQFKQFSIIQNRSAMKVGTDAVLLGAWTSIDSNPASILDIGAGTGVLSLMLVQRSKTETIDAIELDEEAYEECVENFEASPWNDRLFCYHASLDEFTQEMDSKYDLIICNPPFYTSTFPSIAQPNGEEVMSKSRQTARFNDAMPFRQLIESVAKLLSETGSFSVIIPFSEEKDFIVLASKEQLFPKRICRVKGTPNSETKRSLIEFSFKETTAEISELVIENSRHDYTDDYINLTKDFYLKMLV